MQRKQNSLSGLGCRKIDNTLNLNVNVRIQKINKNLIQRIANKEDLNQQEQQIDFKQILKKGANNLSVKYLPYKNIMTKEAATTKKKSSGINSGLNLINKENKNSFGIASNNSDVQKPKKIKNTQLFKVINNNIKNKKNQSPGSSNQKKTKSLSKLDKKQKKLTIIARKSLSPQRSYKLDKTKKSTNKSKTPREMNTLRHNLSSTGINNMSNNIKSYPLTQRHHGKKIFHQTSQSPIKQKSVGKKKSKKKSLNINNEALKHLFQNKPVLDSESINVAKQLHRISTTKNLKLKPNKKILQKNKKSIKIVTSQNASKNRQYSLKQNQNSNDMLVYKYRNSYEPDYKPLKIIKEKKRVTKSQQSIKTNKTNKTQYSSPNQERIKNQAARKIQKVFRGYKTRKEIQKYKKYLKSVIKIQKYFRGYLARKNYQILKNNQIKSLFQQQSLETIKDFNDNKIRLDSSESNLSKKQLEFMINTKQVNTRQKINRLLQNMDSSQQQIFQQKQQKQQKKLISPKFNEKPGIDTSIRHHRPQIKIESPTAILQTLPNLQKIHKQKLIHNCNLQKQSLKQLLQQKFYSPKTYETKIKQLEDRLKYQIERFQLGVRQVVRGWSVTNQQNLGFMTPQNQYKKLTPLPGLKIDEMDNLEYFEKPIQQANKNNKNDIEQLSVELSQQFVEVKQVIQNFQEMKFDSTLLFIQTYLNDLLIFLDNSHQWKQEFLDNMKVPRSIQIGTLLKNLDYLTEQSEQDANFKLPLYKYLKYSIPKLIPEQLINQFHRNNKKLKRHISPNSIVSQLQEIHLRMVTEVLDQELYKQRPIKSLMCFQPLRFTAKVHPSLINKDLDTQELIFHNYFAYAFDEVYRYASQLCGFMEDNKQIEQNYLNIVNECRLTNMINAEIKSYENDNLKFEQEEIEVKVQLAQEVFMALILELTIEKVLKQKN